MAMEFGSVSLPDEPCLAIRKVVFFAGLTTKFEPTFDSTGSHGLAFAAKIPDPPTGVTLMLSPIDH